MERAESRDSDITKKSISEVYAGYYRHYKGPIYLVLGVGRHSESGEYGVVYIPLYKHDGPGFAFRPLDMFFGTVPVDGVEQPRFRYLGLESSAGEVGQSGSGGGEG